MEDNKIIDNKEKDTIKVVHEHEKVSGWTWFFAILLTILLPPFGIVMIILLLTK